MKKTVKIAIGLLALNGAKPMAIKLAMKHEPLRTKLLEKMVQPGTTDDQIESWARDLARLLGWETSYSKRYLRQIRARKRDAL